MRAEGNADESMTGARLISECFEHAIRSILACPTCRPSRYLEPEIVELGHPPLSIALMGDEGENGGTLFVELEPMDMR